MNLKNTILLALALPILACAILLEMWLMRDFDALSKLRDRGRLVELVEKSSALIHELQIERGRSVGAITAGFAEGEVAEVGRQRGQVDTARTLFQTFIAAHEIAERIPEMGPSLEQVASLLDAAMAFRASVDTGQATQTQTLEIYTALIDALIGSVYKAVEQSPSIEVTNGMLPMVTLIEAKEHGGLERALGAALLNQAAAGAADPATYASYYSRLNNETNALDRFRAHGNAEHNRWLREALVGPEVRQVLIWREILQDIVATNDHQGVSGTAWFNAATKRLNRISEVEMRIGGQVTEVLAEQDAAIVSRLWMLASLGGLAILSAIALAAYAGTSAARGLRIVARVIEGLASGDTRVEQTKRRDEVGNILTDLKSLGDRLAASANAADSVSKGYLSGEIPIASDMDRLGNALQVMQHTLNDMAQQTSSMITELTMQSEMLTDMAGEVAHGASEQSRATQSAAAAVEEMNATMRVSSDNASETNEIAAKAADKARGSGVAVARAADAMKKITERIGVVMEIARQTDLLALNAAVEAARAGEHGRGFSVVAQEVRKLAENSGKAAEEIEQLVRQTVDESNNAKQKIDAMLPDILRTSELVAEIVAAMSEQEQGIGQISNALNSLSMANAKSENMGRYSADAAKEVQSIVVRLQEMQGFYKTDEVPMSERISTADNEANAALRAA